MRTFQNAPSVARRIEVAANLGAVKTRRYLAQFARLVGHSELVVDAGSGTAPSPYLHYFASDRYLSFDRFEEADVQADISAIPLVDAKADVILCTEVLEHVSDTDGALTERRRVLKPGGHLILTVPLVGGVHQQVDYFRWTEQGLRQLMQRHQLEVLHFGKRGGIFTCIGHFVHAVPYQLLGPLRRRSIARNLPYLALGALTMPIPWLLSALDFLDSKRNFTLGYALLARKSP